MSRLPLELQLALRYLRPKRTFVSLITMISVVGVMLGVAVLIIVISVMSGFDRQLRDTLFGFNAHLRITMPGTVMPSYREVLPQVADHLGVEGVSPYLLGPIVIETQTTHQQISAPVLRGVDPDHEHQVSTLPDSVVDGDFDVEGQGVVLGYQLAADLNLRLGDPIAIYSHSSLRQMHRLTRGEAEREHLPLPDDFVVRGIFDVGYYEYNVGVLVCSLWDAQDLFLGGSDAVHGLYVVLEDPYRAPQIKAELEAKLGNRYRVSTWYEEHSSILDALVVEKNMIRFLLFFIVLVAAFGITNSQITFVYQKTREIGMLRALGATSSQILLVFLGQSFIVGSAGVAAGLGLGLVAIQYRNEFLLWMNRMTGFNLFPPDIYGFNQLPAIVDPSDVMVICGGSLLICALSGIVPAVNASRLRPVESLRHE